jgi:hypothetical protein
LLICQLGALKLEYSRAKLNTNKTKATVFAHLPGWAFEKMAGQFNFLLKLFLKYLIVSKSHLSFPRY